ncbi:hypothetical protein OG773_02200 [Streptomyces sp. NBC_00140]|nr:hypothetical protein [Streptomyces sp. NBC_00140]
MTTFAAGDERLNAGRVRVGIELDRVLARLEESGGAENVILDEGAALIALGALAIVDPERVGRGVRQPGAPVAE